MFADRSSDRSPTTSQAGQAGTTDALSARLKDAQFRLALESTPQSQAVTALNGVLLFSFLLPVCDPTLLTAWLAVLLAVAALRVGLYLHITRNDTPDPITNRTGALIYCGVAMSAGVWGTAGAALFAAESIAHQALLSFVLAGMTAGAVTTLSAHRLSAFTFVIGATLPLAVRLVLADHEFALGMAFMVAIFAAMMLVSSQRLHLSYRDTLAESLRREAAERELAKIAHFDPLTALPNRRLFIEHATRSIATARRQGGLVAVCYLDLDDFKTLNELYGREIGDQILVRAANKLRSSIRAGDVVARWNGDEFALLLNGVTSSDTCELALRRLIDVVAEPLDMNGHVYALSASIGATLAPGDTDDAETLLRQADHAMYLAKQQGPNQTHIFDAVEDGADKRTQDTRDELHSAVSNEELVLFYQPKVDMSCGVVYGAEGLIRWQHPERGLLAPGAFLPQWEADASMAEVDRWVLTRAFEQVDEWLSAGLDLVLSVNVSAWLLHSDDFTLHLENLLQAHPSCAGHIELEITETRALDDIGRISDVMQDCEDMNVQFALDDFGTGFSSLVHLQRLPAHTLKIDTSFVRGMLDNEHDSNLVRGIIGLGHALGKAVVAEGVETEAHGEVLCALGCHFAQGYGIAKPMPESELRPWITDYVMPTTWRGDPDVASIVGQRKAG